MGVIRSFSEKLFFAWLLDDYFFVSLSFALFSFSFYTLLWLFFRLSILFIDFLACFLFFCYLWSFSELHLHCPQKRCRLLIAQFCCRLVLLKGLDNVLSIWLCCTSHFFPVISFRNCGTKTTIHLINIVLPSFIRWTWTSWICVINIKGHYCVWPERGSLPFISHKHTSEVY